MKFEKINDNILKIVLSFDELPDCDSLTDLMSNADLAKDSFLGLLDKASSMVGFDTSDYKVKIQAQALHNGNFVITVTKLIGLRGAKKSAVPRRVPKSDTSSPLFVVYRFNSFDDFCSFCSCLKSYRISYINRITKYCYLYEYVGSYFLVCKNINENHKQIALFYTIITEFSEFFSNRELFCSSLRERGTLVLDNNALVLGQKLC